jgi:hypothetical protein
MESCDRNRFDQNRDEVIERKFLQILCSGKLIVGVCDLLMERRADDSLDTVVSNRRHTERLAMLKSNGRAIWLKTEDLLALQHLLERLQRGEGAAPAYARSRPSYELRETVRYTVPLQAAHQSVGYAGQQQFVRKYQPRNTYRSFKPPHSRYR